jgi:hypothetical protein
VNFFSKKVGTPIASPVNRFLLLFFAFFCLGIKMKNPEKESISGFCCKFHFHSAEKEGLLSVIPFGDTLQLKLLPYSFHSYGLFIFHMSSLMQAWFGHLQNKNPPALPREYFNQRRKRALNPSFDVLIMTYLQVPET